MYFPTYPELTGNRCNGNDVRPPKFPKTCPTCGTPAIEITTSGRSYDCKAVYTCGGGYSEKPQIQNHTDYFWGSCGKVREARELIEARFPNDADAGIVADWLDDDAGRPDLAELLRPRPTHQELLDGLTPAQRDELGVMFGMSNCGMDRFAKPEQLAETDRDFRYFMQEIRVWQKLLRKKGENWECFKDFPEMVAEAKRRRPEIKALGKKRPCRRP